MADCFSKSELTDFCNLMKLPECAMDAPRRYAGKSCCGGCKT